MYSITARRVQNQHVGQPADVPHTKGPEDKKRRSFRQATVRSLLRSKTENRMTGGEQNQKHKWKHAFKRTTSNSKRGLIKKILNLMNTS